MTSIEEITDKFRTTVNKLLNQFLEIAQKANDNTTVDNIAHIRQEMQLGVQLFGSIGAVMINASGWFLWENRKEIIEHDEKYFMELDINILYSDYEVNGKTKQDFILANQLVNSLRSAFHTLKNEEKLTLWKDVDSLLENMILYSKLKKKDPSTYPKYYKL